MPTCPARIRTDRLLAVRMLATLQVHYLATPRANPTHSLHVELGSNLHPFLPPVRLAKRSVPPDERLSRWPPARAQRQQHMRQAEAAGKLHRQLPQWSPLPVETTTHLMAHPHRPPHPPRCCPRFHVLAAAAAQHPTFLPLRARSGTLQWRAPLTPRPLDPRGLARRVSSAAEGVVLRRFASGRC